jgi:hypothetical protein
MSSKVLAKRLGKKQLDFANLILEGKTSREAYRGAQYKAKAEKVVDAAASQLLRNIKVTAYIDACQVEVAEKANEALEITVTAKKAILWGIAEACGKVQTDENNIDFIGNSRAAIAAIAELNKMDGDYAPIKTENLNLNDKLTPVERKARIAELSEKLGRS